MNSSKGVWLTTGELCNALSISRSKLYRLQQRKVFRQGIHWVRKKPSAPRSDQFWSLAVCRSAPKGLATRKGTDGPLFDWSVVSPNQAACWSPSIRSGSDALVCLSEVSFKY